MNIAVTYNQPQNGMYGERKDKLSEDTVLDEVSDVEKALKELGHRVSLLPLKDDASQFIARAPSFMLTRLMFFSLFQ